MPLIIKYKDGTEVEDFCATSHDDGEDSYSLADVVNQAIHDIQNSLEMDGFDFGFDFVNKYGVESIKWDRDYSYTQPDDIEIAEFLHRFHSFEHDVTYTFIHGCCYWFAVMMHNRFPNSRIMFVYPMHFVTEIKGRLYDIRGDVTDKYLTCVSWDEMDLAEKKYIESNAIFWNDGL